MLTEPGSRVTHRSAISRAYYYIIDYNQFYNTRTADKFVNGYIRKLVKGEQDVIGISRRNFSPAAYAWHTLQSSFFREIFSFIFDH